jgi:hypothetical protein
MTEEQIEEYLQHLSVKESGWLLKSKAYDVKIDSTCFSIKMLGSSRNGPMYPIIEGDIIHREFMQVNLDIRTSSYFNILFPLSIGVILFVTSLLSEEMTVNGVYRPVGLIERVGWSLFGLGVPVTLVYFNTIKPIHDAEKWLIKKLRLRQLIN